MSALQDQESPRRRQSGQVIPLRPRQSKASHWVVTAEVGAKVLVNGVLSAVAVTTLVNLLPHYLSQQAKLQEVQSEVQQTSAQVNQLQEEFIYTFDPQQARRVMQAQSGRVDPHQRQIVLIDKKEKIGGY